MNKDDTPVLYRTDDADRTDDTSWLSGLDIDSMIELSGDIFPAATAEMDDSWNNCIQHRSLSNGANSAVLAGNPEEWESPVFDPFFSTVHGHCSHLEFNEGNKDNYTNLEHPKPDTNSQFPMDAPSQSRQERKQLTLPRRRSRYLLRRSGSRTRAIAIPTPSGEPEDVQSLTMQRWRNSPPEDEAASLSAIYGALKDQPQVSTSFNERVEDIDVSPTYRANSSATSLDSGQSGDSDKSGASASSRASESRNMRNRLKGKRKTQKDGKCIFKCTFCCDTFKRKYDWVRHEKSLHLNMEEWRCAPEGLAVVNHLTGRVHCAYCGVQDPDAEHLEKHNSHACESEEVGRPTFRRKDHLVQHLRLVHDLDAFPFIDKWKKKIGPIVSRCGFCNQIMSSWDERSDHLANHFRKGKTMADWKGEHGFDEPIAARVTNCMAPYLIASESISLVPYSATNPNSTDLFNQISSQINRLSSGQTSEPKPILPENSFLIPEGQQSLASQPQSRPPQQEIDTIVFTEILTRHLGQFARQHMAMGIVPTDEMFQRESRRVLFDGVEDEWNQTVADHPDWIAAFRQRYGLNS